MAKAAARPKKIAVKSKPSTPVPAKSAPLASVRAGLKKSPAKPASKPVGKAAAREGKPLLIADDRLKGRYFDIAHPRLAAEVKAGSNTIPPFELTD